MTSPDTHRIAARLLETGLDFSAIAEKAILTQEYANMKLLGRILGNADRNSTGEILWSVLDGETKRGLDISGQDNESIMRNLSFVEGVQVALLFREVGEKTYKISLRSRGKVDVSEAANRLDPDGGGHARAAGCTVQGNLEAIIQKTVACIEDMFGKQQK